MADALNTALNIVTLGVVAGLIWWLTRWERHDRRDHRAVARAVDHHDLESDSFELSRALIEVRRRLAAERPNREYVADYLDGVRDRAAPDERPPLHSV